MKAIRYLLCLLPPLAVLSCKKPGQTLFSLVLTIAFYFPGVVHAVLVVNAYHADLRRRDEERRHRELLEAMNGGRRV